MTTDAERAAEIIMARCAGRMIEQAVVLGTGLGNVADGLEDIIAIPYAQLPGFPQTPVSGHDGMLIIANQDGVNVAYMRGRAHFYENGDAAAMATPLETLALLGAQTFILTGAVGSVRADIHTGNLVIISDHINFGGINPLIGLASDGGFVNMTEAYDPKLFRRLKRAAVHSGLQSHEGVYMWFSGPSFETPAEIRMARALGADVVGMSMAPEVILARRLGVTVGAIGVVTNYGAGFSGGNPTHSETVKQAQAGAIGLRRMFRIFPKIIELG